MKSGRDRKVDAKEKQQPGGRVAECACAELLPRVKRAVGIGRWTLSDERVGEGDDDRTKDEEQSSRGLGRGAVR